MSVLTATEIDTAIRDIVVVLNHDGAELLVMEAWGEVIRGLSTYRQALGPPPIAEEDQILVDATLRALFQRMVDPHTSAPHLTALTRLFHALTMYRYSQP